MTAVVKPLSERYPVLRRRVFWATLSLSSFLLLWQAFGSLIDPLFFSSPSAIVRAVPAVLRRGLVDTYLATMGLYLFSVSTAIVLGTSAGLAIGMLPTLREFVRPVVAAMYATPTIVLIPILVVWLGDGMWPVFTLVFVASFFPMLFNTQLGVEEVGADMKELGRAFGATGGETLTKIVIPSMLPYAFSGMKIAIPRGFIAVLAAEMLITARGTGGLVLYYGDAFQTDRYFVPVILLTATAYLINEAVHVLEVRVMPWKASAETH